MSEVTCFRLHPILYLNDVSLVCPLAALPHQSFCEDLSHTDCSGLCIQNHKPGCVLAVTDVHGDTSVPCTVGAVATRLSSPPPSQRWLVLAGGHARTACLPSWAHLSSDQRSGQQGCCRPVLSQAHLGSGGGVWTTTLRSPIGICR